MFATNSIVSEKSGGASWIDGLLLGLLGVLIISIVTLSLVPPVSKDALIHHLAVPKLYLEHGGIYEIPSMVYSYYPMNLDLLYMIPLYFGHDILPKFIHFSFALLTAWMIFLYVRQRMNDTYALLGVILFLSIPIIVKLSITVYVDLGVIFFSFASLFLVFEWIKSHFRFRFLILSAISCGLAMGVKYNGLVTFFLLTFFVPYVSSKYSKKARPGFLRPVGYGLIFCVVALFVFSPWMVRNYIWKSNPIYPLYDSWFNPPKDISKTPAAEGGLKKVKHGVFNYRSIVYEETWWEMALLPLRIFFQGKDGKPQFFDGKLNPFLLILPIFAFYRIREGPEEIRTEKKILLSFAVLFFFFALFTRGLRIRYFSPFIPPLVILSVFGVRNIVGIVKRFHSKTSQKVGSAIVFLLLTFSLVLNGAYIFSQFKYVEPLSYLGGTLNRDEYIAKNRYEYPAMQYINNHLPSDAMILFVFLGTRGYYCDREYRVLGENVLGWSITDSNTPEEIHAVLKALGVTHLLIYHDLLEKWVRNKFSEDKRRNLELFFRNYVKLLYYEKGFSVSTLQ